MKSIRDVVTGELSLEYFAKRFSEGWKVASIEWVQESGEPAASKESANLLNVPTEPPYGFQITQTGIIEECTPEATVLLLILELVVKEKSVQQIALDLNAKGYVTREGAHWSASSVFNLLPRLIEAGPSLLKSDAWRRRRLSTTGISESIQ